MSNLGKCGKCEKTVYGMEGFKVGPPSKEVAFHKVLVTTVPCVLARHGVLLKLVFLPLPDRWNTGMSFKSLHWTSFDWFWTIGQLPSTDWTTERV